MSLPVMYVDDEYGWLLLFGPARFDTYPRIQGYTPLGVPSDCVREVYRFMEKSYPHVRQNGGGRQTPPLQQIIADGVGANQRSVSNWIARRSEPDLHQMSPDGVRWLVQAVRSARSEKRRRKTVRP